jgi:hypothetical protein
LHLLDSTQQHRPLHLLDSTQQQNKKKENYIYSNIYSGKTLNIWHRKRKVGVQIVNLKLGWVDFGWKKYILNESTHEMCLFLWKSTERGGENCWGHCWLEERSWSCDKVPILKTVNKIFSELSHGWYS